MEGNWAWKPEDEDFYFFKEYSWLITDPAKAVYFFLFMAVLGLCHCTGFAPIAASGGYSLAVVLRLLFAVASLAAEHGLQGAGVGLSSCGSQALEHRLNSCGLVVPKPGGSSRTRDRTPVSCTGSRFFNTEPPTKILGFFSPWHKQVLS